MPDHIGSDKPDSISPERLAFDDVFSLVYEELRRLASQVRYRDSSLTLNSTALVNEAWLKLKESPQLANTCTGHFKAIAARAMRQILVDAARKRHSRKRGFGDVVSFLNANPEAKTDAFDGELLALNTALEKLETLNARQARVVDCRFFGGLSTAETAELLNVSESAVERDWRAAKAWLASIIENQSE